MYPMILLKVEGWRGGGVEGWREGYADGCHSYDTLWHTYLGVYNVTIIISLIPPVDVDTITTIHMDSIHVYVVILLLML